MIHEVANGRILDQEEGRNERDTGRNRDNSARTSGREKDPFHRQIAHLKKGCPVIALFLWAGLRDRVVPKKDKGSTYE
jgi:hypothetical protein